MRRQSCWAVRFVRQASALALTTAALLCGAQAADGGTATTPGKSVSKVEAAKRLQLLPLSFEQNQGQTDARVKFLSRGPGYTMFLTGSDTVLSLQAGKRTDALRLHWQGANANTEVTGADPLALKSNYFLGNDPAKWRTNVGNYGRVRYTNLYPGTDLIFYGQQGMLESDLVLAPGAEPSKIALRIEGARAISVDADGNLVVTTAHGKVRLLKPRTYQQRDGRMQEVAAAYRVGAHGIVRFDVAAYDHTRPLVIDPAIDYLTYVSTATGSISVNAMAADATNSPCSSTAPCTYVAGATSSASLPNLTGAGAGSSSAASNNKDSFILKLDGKGAASFVVYLGGSGDDSANGIAVGSSGNLYVAGQTKSKNFPVTAQTFQSTPAGTCAGQTCTNNTAFISKLSNDGTQLLYSTFVGGSGDDVANAIAVSSPQAFITGATTSSSGSGGTAFPNNASNAGAFTNISKAGNTDGFVAVVTTENETIPSTAPSCGTFTATCAPATCHNNVATLNLSSTTKYKAGDWVKVSGIGVSLFNVTAKVLSASGTQITYTVATCSGGSNNQFSTGPGTITGSLVYGSYFGANSGSTGNTVGNAIAIDNSGFADITGSNTANFNTTGGVFETTSGGGTDAIVTQFDPTTSGAGSQNFATFVGGAGADIGNAVATDSSGNIYVAGSTTSTEQTSKICPAGGCTPQAANGNTVTPGTPSTTTDGFIVKLNSTGTTRSWGTYLGGSGNDVISRLRWDGTNLYAAGTTTSTGFLGSTVFGSLSGTQDGFVASILPSGTPAINYGLYVGGSGNADAVTAFVLDPATSTAFYVGGNTDSSDLSTTASAYQVTPAQTLVSGTASAGFAAHYNIVTANPVVLAAAAGAATLNNPSAAPGLASPNLIWYDSATNCAASGTTCSDVTIPFTVTNNDATNAATDVVVNIAVTNVAGAPPVSILSATPNPAAAGVSCGTPVTTATFSGVTCNISSLAATTGQQFDIRTLATSTATGTNVGSNVTLTASATGANVNTAAAVTSTALKIVPVAKLTVSAPTIIPDKSSTAPYSDSVFRVDYDTTLEWDFTVANGGPGTASDARLSVTLPTGTNMASVVDAGTNTCPNLTNPSGTIITCDLPSLLAGAITTVKLKATPPALAGATATLSGSAASATIAGGYADDGTTNSANYSSTERREAVVSVAVTPTPITGVNEGGAINGGTGYQVTVSNAGPSNATGVHLGFTLDTGSTAAEVGGQLTGIQVTGAGSGYTSAPTLTISGGGASVNATATTTISAQVSNTVTVNTPGAGYTNPVVTISGGGGSGATATATQTAGQITGITVTNQGSGYAFPPNVTITDGGYGAAATAQVAAGSVTGFTILNGGSGYITPTVTLIGGDGTGATATATVTAGVITAINVVNPGTGYNTIPPTVVITETGGGPGTGATATATLVNGTVIAATLTSAGTGYTTAPTITPSSGGATFTAGGIFAGANFTSLVSSDTTNCSPATQGFTCTVTSPLIAGGASYTMNVTANAPASIHPSAATQTFSDTNSATTAMISSTTTLGSGGLALTGSAAFSTTVERDTDLAVASIFDNSPVNLSGSLTYTTAIENNGGDDAEGVVVKYTFPAGTLQNSTPGTAGYITDDYGAGQCVISSNTYTCTVGHLEKTNGTTGVGSRVFHVTVLPLSSWASCGSASCNFNVTAAISGNVVDNTNTNDSATVQSTVQRKADLQVTLPATSDNSPISTAGPLKLYATVQDLGPDDANATNGVRVTYTVPNGGYRYDSSVTTFNANSASSYPNGACTQPIQGNANDNVITCVLPNGLTVAQGAITYGIGVDIPGGAVPATNDHINIVESVSIDSNSTATDSVSGNNGPVNYASTIDRVADLKISSQVDNSPVSLAGPLKLYATIQDLGPDDATGSGGVTVTFTMPATGYTVATSATFKGGANAFPNGACTPTDGSSATITCTLSSGLTKAAGAVTYGLAVNPPASLVGAGTSSTTINPTVAIAGAFIVEATANTDGAYNQAQVGANGPLTYTSTVQRTSNLQVTTVSSNSPAAIAGPLKLYATIQNFGPDDATATGGVTVTFALPTGYTYNSSFAGTFAGGATGLTGAACTQVATSVTCNFTGGLTVAAGAITYGLPVTPPTNAVGAGASSATLTGTSASIGGSNIVNATASGDGAYGTAAPGSTTTMNYTGVVVQRSSDLTVTLPATSDNSPVAISGTLQLYSTVQNAGPDDATGTGGVTITYGVLSGYTLNASYATFAFANGAVDYPSGACTQTNATTITCTLTSGMTVASGAVKYGLPLTPPASAVPTNTDHVVITPSVTIAGLNLANVKKGTDDSYNVAETVTTQNYSSTIQRQSDLQFVVAGSGATSPVALNDSFNPLSITTNLTNAGPDPAYGVQVQYTFPATTNNAYTIKSPATGCTKVANVITCTIGSGVTAGQLAASASSQLVLQLLPDPALVSNNADQASITVYPEIVSTAVVDSGQSANCSVTPSNNCGSNSSTLQRRSNLSVVVSNPSSTVKGPFTISATVTNNGTDDVPQSTLLGSDLATCGGVTCNNVPNAIAASPVGSAIVVYSLPTALYTLVGNTYPAGAVCAQNGATVTCQNVTAIANGAAPVFGISVTPDPNAITSGNSTTANFSAVVKSAVAIDGTPANDTSNGTVTISRKVDLQLITETNNGPVNSKPNSSTVQFTTKVQNVATTGFGDDATGVVVTYTLPDNTYRWATDSYGAGACTQPAQGNTGDNVITCTVGALNSGASVTNTLTVTITDPSAVPTNANNISKNYSVTVSSPNVVDDGTAGAPGANNTKSDTFVIRRLADLKMPNTPAGMTDNSPIGVTSGTLTLTNNVQNAGPDDAIGVTVTYTFLSTGYTVTGNTYPGGCAAQSGTTVTCTVGTLAASTSTTAYMLSVKPDPTWVSNTSTTGSTTVSAAIQSADVYDDGTGGAANLVAGDNSNSTTPSIRRSSDLQVTAFSDNSQTTPVALAGPLTFSTTVQNVNTTGFGDDAVGVVVQYTLPADSSPSSGYRLATYTGTNPPPYPGGACTQPALGLPNDNVITCTVGSLTVAAGATSYGLSVTPDPNGVATNANVNHPATTVKVSSTAVIDDGTAGAPGANNAKLVTSNLVRNSDLRMNSITDNSQATPVSEAGPLNYSTLIQNFGPDTAVGVTVTYTLPNNQWRFVPSFAGTNAWPSGDCSQPAPGNSGDNVVTCTLPTGVSVAAGQQTYVLSVTPDPAAVPTSAATVALPVTAQVSSAFVFDDGTNGAPGTNNNGAVTSNIRRQSDLQLASLTDNSPISQAGPIQYTATLQDNGPDDAVGVIVKYTLPNANYTMTSYTGPNAYPGGACVQATNSITCTVGNLTKAAGATQFVLAVTPDPALVATTVNSATALTTAQVSSTDVVDDGTSGAPGSNNSAQVTTTVRRLADLSVVTIADNSPIRQGVPLTFTTKIQDLGPDDAVNVQVRYTVPNGSYILGTHSYGTGNCNQAGNVITCTVGSLTVAQGAQTYTLSVTPDPNAVATNVPSATVSTGFQVLSADVYDNGTGGAAGANNSSSVNSTIQRQSDLVNLSLTDNSPVGSAGPLTFTSQIQNSGPNDAVGVIVTYTLPTAGYTLVSQDYGTNACIQSGATVTCQVGTLTASTGKTNTLSVTPDPNAVSTTSNTGTAITTTLVSSADVVDDGTSGAPGANNTQQITSTVQRLVHLVVTGHISNPAPGTFATLGSTVEYEVDVQNAAKTVGGATTTSALGVTLDEVLPATFLNPTVDTLKSTSGWTCDFTTHPTCAFSGSITSGATVKLFITGSYVDDGTSISLAGGGGYAPGTGSGGNVTATPGTTLSTNVDPLVAVTTHTDIERLVGLSATAASNPAGGTQTFANLGTTVTYTIVLNNASTATVGSTPVATNTATGVFVTVTIPPNFIGVTIDPTSSAGWTCNPANFSSTTVTCTQSNPLGHPGSSTLVLKGTYSDDPAVSILPSGGRANVQVSATPGSTLSLLPAAAVMASTNTDIQRLVHLTATHTSNPAVGSFANLGSPVTYTVIVSNAPTVNSATTNTATGVVVNETLPANFINPTVTSSNWSCNFTATPAVCSYAKSIGSGTAAVDALTIAGQYDDSVTATVLPGGGTYQPGTGNVTATAALASTSSYDPSPVSVGTSTDIRRNVNLTIAQSPPSVDPVSLGQTISYTLQAANAAGNNTAAGVTITDTFPSGFLFTSASGSNWSCAAPSSGALTCTTPSVASGGTSTPLVITGSYDPTLSLTNGQATRTNTGAVGSTLSFNNSITNTTASVNSTVERSSNLAVAITAPTQVGAVPTGAPSTLSPITYTVKVSNTGTNDANSVKVDFQVPLPGNFKNIAASGTGSSTVACDTTSTQGHVICTYATQTTTNPTVITVTGQFDQGAVVQNGSATATNSVAVSTADSVDPTATNKQASATVVVVDTPVGNNVSPLLNVEGKPITVTYPSVTTAGITTQVVSVVPPIGFHEPAIDYPTVDYSTTTPNYFIIASDASAPVTYTTPVSVCVAYTALNGLTFLKPERVRMFDATGKDVTSSLNATMVCGMTSNAGPNLGSFTVREPKNHAPVAKAAAQQLFSGKIGTNQFTLDASGTTDADIQQICNGSKTQLCGDTLTYTWSGPPGMNPTNGSSTFTQSVAANADGTLGAPAQVTGSFPLGISTVTLTVTDQTGASSTSQVSVTVNSFTLSTTNQAATISPGQSTSFQVVPQDANKQPLQFTGSMTMACTGFNNADHSSLSANHISCSVSPAEIQQGQFATAIIVTTGPNFSQARPVHPGSSNGGGTLALLFALTSPALMGVVLLPGRSRRWKGLLILALLLACIGIQLGCGGSGSTPPAQTISPTTPAGTYTITITGTIGGTVTSTNTFTLTVH